MSANFFYIFEEIDWRATVASGVDLTALEQQTLLAVLRLHPRGYGVSIRDEIEQLTDRSISFGTIYATLDRL